jgi:hypothetical protein
MNWHRFATQAKRRGCARAPEPPCCTLRSQVRFRPLLELPFGEDLAERIASETRRRGLLPLEEVHDSLILAESALLDCSILLTSDEHLRAIDHEQATLLLRSYDLVAPIIATPKEIVRKFFR